MADRTTSYAAQDAERREDMKSVVATIDQQQAKYAGILPSNVRWEDFRNAFLIAVQINPRLLEADRQSLWLALQKAAAAGLKPDNQEGALVIFGDDTEDEDGKPIPSAAKGKKKVQWMPMVWGITKQMRNTGNVASVRAKVIYRGERVIVTDENGHETYKHERTIESGSDVDETDENIVGAYAVVLYKDGFWDAEFMSRRQLTRIQARAKSKRGPWATHFPQQCMKTPLRRLSLRVEKSAENERYFRGIQDDETLATIDGDPVTELAQPVAIEQDQSIKQEFTKPVEKAAAGRADTAQRGAAQAKAQATAAAANAASATATSGSGKPAFDPGEQRKAEEREQAAAAGQSVEIEIWAVDAGGEPLEQMEPMTPGEFASWFAGHLFLTNSDALMEHNADAIADCRSDPSAFGKINDAIARHRRSQEKPTAAPAQEVQQGQEKPTDPAPQARRVPIKVPRTPKGSEHWPNYGPIAFEQIAGLKDEADILDWIATNKPTYQNKSVEIAIDNRIQLARSAMGAPDTSNETASLPSSTDDEFVAAVLAQLATFRTEQEIQHWSKGGSVQKRMHALRTSHPVLWQSVVDRVEARMLAVKAPGEEPPA